MSSKSVNITIESEDLTALQKGLSGTKRSIQDWRDEFDVIGGELKTVFSGATFTTGGGYIGFNWQGLSPSYEVYKRQKYPGRNILEATGKMRKSFAHEASSNELVLMNETDYAKYHQYGKGVPQRPIMNINNSVMDIVRDVFEKGISKRLRENLKR